MVGETPSRLHGEEHQTGQSLLVDANPVDGDAFANKLFANEVAHLLGADAGDQGRLEPEPRRSDRNVRRTAADRLRETSDVLESAADLLAIEID